MKQKPGQTSLTIKMFGRGHLPFNLPPLFLEALVDGLRDRALHEVDVPDHLRRERVSQVLVELPVFQVV